MSLSAFIRALSTFTRFLRDINAVTRGRTKQRLVNRLIGRTIGRSSRRLWR